MLDLVADDISEAVIDHQEGAASWREAGAGPPVVFLHGLGGSRLSWAPQLRALSASFRCIAWDMPGYGLAEPLTPLTYEGIAQRLVDLLDVLDIEQADLVGLSFGGMHALHTALRHPHRVGRMVLVDSSPAFGMDGTTREDWTRSRLDAIDRGETPATIASAVIDSITAKPLSGHIRDEVLAGFGEIPVNGFRAAVECLPTNDVRDQLSEVSHRCCVVVGELDEETPVSYAQVLADGLPNSEMYVINGVGHLTPSEAPDRFNAIVAAFLERDTHDQSRHPTQNLESEPQP